MNFLYFMRHGETDYNKQNKWMGSTDISLNSTGEKQVLETGKCLANAGITKIYCSPLLRAKRTAELLVSSLNIEKVIIINELSERNFGGLEGKIKTTARIEKMETYSFIESLEIFNNRIKRAIELISWDPSSLIVSHSGVFRSILSINEFTNKSGINGLGNAEYVKVYRDCLHSSWHKN